MPTIILIQKENQNRKA